MDAIGLHMMRHWWWPIMILIHLVLANTNYEACSVCHCDRFLEHSFTCNVSALDPELLFNFTTIPERLENISIESDLHVGDINYNRPCGNSSQGTHTESFYIPPYALVALPNIIAVNFQSLRVVQLNHESIAGLKLEQFNAIDTCFEDVPFNFLKQVASSLRVISLYNVDFTWDRQTIYLRSFPKLQSINIEIISSVSTYIYVHDLPSLNTLKITGVPLLTQIGYGALALGELPNLTKLNLTLNSLQTIPYGIRNFHSLQSLHLGHNLISNINHFVFLSGLTSLQELYLYGNNVTSVSKIAVKNLKQLPNLHKVYMSDNPFNCTCELKAFVVWLRDTVVDVGRQWHFPKNGTPYQSSDDDVKGNESSYKCAFPAELFGVSVFTVLQMNCTTLDITTTPWPKPVTNEPYGERGATGVYIGPVVLVAVFVGLIGIILVIICIIRGFRAYLNVMRNRRPVGLFAPLELHDHDEIDRNVAAIHEFKYDAYVCHHDNLIDFVVYNFMPRLEENPNDLKLCLSFRDFIVGADKLDNITDAFESSRSSIFLIDEDFVNSNQCMLELKICCSYMLDDARPVQRKQQGIILILLDAIPRDRMPPTLRVLVNKITYLEWNHLDEEKTWRQLEASLRTLRDHGED